MFVMLALCSNDTSGHRVRVIDIIRIITMTTLFDTSLISQATGWCRSYSMMNRITLTAGSVRMKSQQTSNCQC